MAGAVLIGVSFCAGRASVPEANARLADSLNVTKPAHDSLRKTARDSTAAIEEEVRAALARVDAERRRSTSAREFADLARRRADSLAARLKTAQTERDSLTIYPIQVAELRQEGDSLRFANDTLLAAVDTAVAKIKRLQFNVELLGQQIVRDSVRLGMYKLAVDDLRRHVEGCRILGVKCPVLGADYTPSTKQWGATVAYPIKGWLHIGIRHEF